MSKTTGWPETARGAFWRGVFQQASDGAERVFPVRRIEWDECPTEEAARHREELLICVLAPKFNAAGKVWERKRSGELHVHHPIIPGGQPHLLVWLPPNKEDEIQDTSVKLRGRE